MNRLPDEFVRVPHEDLRGFVSTAARDVGVPEEQAALLSEVLVANDLRGVFSHGTRQIAAYRGSGYVRMLRDGEVNPNPDVTVARETPASVLLDGDGGLGFFPASRGIHRAIEKAEEGGVAAMATRNHGHFGAAGTYARESAERNLLAFVTSGHQLDLSPGDPIYSAAGGSPMAFCAPTSEEDPIVLDFGTMSDLYPDSPHRDEIAELAPGLVLRHVGMGAICQSWGGLLTGLGIDEPRDYQTYSGANQGSFALVFRIDLFGDPDRFRREVDEYVRQVRDFEPLEGFEEALLPGGPEAQRERENRDLGVPLGPGHRTDLEGLADDLGIDVPWASNERS